MKIERRNPRRRDRPRSSSAPEPAPSFAELFTPKLVTVLREGYGMANLRADAIAGLTVAIVALPLSMAIAIASGATPAQGLYTAIVGGFLVSALGGSRFQIGGPAGAFIVLIAATVAAHGIDGLILATFLSGILLAAVGLLRLGSLIKFIPFPVTVGFTAGIAVIIFASQIKELTGLSLASEPGPLAQKLPALWEARGTADAAAIGISVATVLLFVAVRRFRPTWPGALIAVAATAGATALFDLPVATIGSQFGGIPHSLPVPALPDISWERCVEVLPAALSFTLLGAIESLLSAVVADGMTGRRHRSNCELLAQGVANIGSSLFGGICVTGTIARTATNVRSGAHGPIAGMLHAVILLIFMLVAAPLASEIPLAALAGVLVIVAWNMVEIPAIIALVRSGPGETAVLTTTLLLTIFRDLSEAIVAGTALGSVLFIRQISRSTALSSHLSLVPNDVADSGRPRTAEEEALSVDPHVLVYRIRGALFFGATAATGAVLDRFSDRQSAFILDLEGVPFLDATGANMVHGVAHKAWRRGARVILAGTTHDHRRELFAHGVSPPLVTYSANVETALRKARASINGQPGGDAS